MSKEERKICRGSVSYGEGALNATPDVSIDRAADAPGNDMTK